MANFTMDTTPSTFMRAEHVHDYYSCISDQLTILSKTLSPCRLPPQPIPCPHPRLRLFVASARDTTQNIPLPARGAERIHVEERCVQASYQIVPIRQDGPRKCFLAEHTPSMPSDLP